LLIAANALLFYLIDLILELNQINFYTGRLVFFEFEVLYCTEDIKQVVPDNLVLAILVPGYTDTHLLTIDFIHDDIVLLVLYEVQITEEG
jgi:hypothetical protein